MIAAEVDEEIQFHLDRRTEELVRRGLLEPEARAQAREEFGDVGRARSDLLTADLRNEALKRRREWGHDLLRDLRFAARTLRRSPGWATTTVLTLAIGIGAATAVFAAFEGIILRRLPILSQDEVVVIATYHPARADAHIPLTFHDVREFEESSVTLARGAAVEYNRPAESILQSGSAVFGGRGARVTGDFFGVLGVVPVLGRMVRGSDDVPGAEPVMVVGYGLWMREFGGDPDVLGRRIAWNGFTHTVVGVAPEGFAYPHGAEFWTAILPALPTVLEESPAPNETTYFHLVGRREPGRTAADVASEFQRFLARTDPRRDEALRGTRAVVTPLPEMLFGEVRTPMLAVYAAGLLVLLLTCFNVAGLHLARGTSRGRELAIRAALGADRWRIGRQLLTEAGLLALLGGVLGCGLAWLILQGLLASAPPEFPRIESVRLDLTALAFASAATMAAALVSGLAPALWASSRAVSLRAAGATAEFAPGAQWTRRGIVVAQTALAVLILSGAGLLLRSVQNLQSLDLGFEPDHLMIAQLQLPLDGGSERSVQLVLVEAALERLRRIPGVEAATSVAVRPFADTGGWDALVSGEGQDAAARATNPLLNFEVVSPGYFETFRIPLVSGRGFAHSDHENALPVAVISESAAHRLWPGEEPVGQRIKIGEPDGPMPWHTVVGVVRETRYREFVAPRPTFYLPVRQFGGPVPMRVAVRSAVAPHEVLPIARAALREVHPDLVIANATPMPQLLSSVLASPRFSAILLGAFAVVATSLAAVGLFGLMAAFVGQHRAELAIRRAVGASSADIVRLVLRRGMGVSVLGAGFGILIVLLGGRVLTGLLYGVEPYDVTTLAGVFFLLALTSAAACASPVRKALRADPSESLREG